jgi:hypothetical protein
MFRHFWLAAWLIVTGVAVAQLPPKAPPQPTGKPGETIVPFQAVKVAGPDDMVEPGNFTSYASTYGNRPQAIIFARKADDRLAAMVKALDEAIAADETKQLCAYVVIFDKDREKSEAAAKKFCEGKTFPRVPIVFPTAADVAFRSYGISPTADATVVTAQDAKVLTNYAGVLNDGAISKTVENLRKANEKARLAAEEQRRRSGLQKGVTMQPYYAVRWSGADPEIKEGEGVSWRCRYNGSPQVAVFTRKVNYNVVELVKALDDAVKKNEKRNLHAYLTILGPPELAAAEAKEFASKYEITRLPIVVATEAEKGPAELQLNPEVEVTVMVLNWNTEVSANHVTSADLLDEDFIKRVLRDVTAAKDPPANVKVIRRN